MNRWRIQHYIQWNRATRSIRRPNRIGYFTVHWLHSRGMLLQYDCAARHLKRFHGRARRPSINFVCMTLPIDVLIGKGSKLLSIFKRNVDCRFYYVESALLAICVHGRPLDCVVEHLHRSRWGINITVKLGARQGGLLAIKLSYP